jgi:cell division protein FtsN
MTEMIAYEGKRSSERMHSSFRKFTILFPAIFLLLITRTANSQNLPDYDEISVFIEMQEVGGGEIDALIRRTDLYLPVIDLFDFLKVRNVPSPGFDIISGFFIDPSATYSINRTENRIIYQGKSFDLQPGDIIRTESNLYLKSDWYGKIFGLDCKFNFRALSVTISSKLELPVIKEMRQEKMRSNISRLKGDFHADSIVKRTYPLFKFGMADWSVVSQQEINGKSDARLNLSLGSMIAGGEATANLYYSSSEPFSEKQQYYLWRYVNNDFAPLRQILAGKIATNAISSIYSPVIGIQLTNTPTTYRRSFGTYTLSDKTEPGWIVELYVNNVLVDYVKADASGFFTFEVPLVYGNSMIRLKFFGPWGEERTREQNINIPYNFLPKNTFEYTFSAGIVEDSTGSRFSRADFNYGVTRGLTVGAGAEYLSSISSQPLMPFLNASLRVTNNILFSGEYAPGVRAKGTLSYRLPSNVQLDLNYTWYDKNQKAIFYNYREERRASLTVPLKIGKISTFQRFSYYQIVLPSSKYTTGEWLISGAVNGISTNLTTYALMLEKASPYMYSNLSMSFRLPAGFMLIPQVQYGYTEKRLFSARVGVEKHLFTHGFMNLSYEQNFKNDIRLAEVGFRYDFSFAQTGASVRQTNNTTSFNQYARGSLLNDRKTKYLGTDYRANVGRGGIAVVPFLDLNANGRRDPNEPKAYGLNLHASSGRVEKSDRDTTIRILGLEPYTNCFVELDPSSFENVSWRFSKLTYNIAVDPNIIKLVEIPVTVAGEADGSVMRESESGTKGIGRIIVTFSDKSLRVMGKQLTEDDGYFSYMGLTPGTYRVAPDSSQLRKLGLISEPESRQFVISQARDGDIVEGLDFVLKSKVKETVPLPEAVTELIPQARKDTTVTILHELSEVVYTIPEDSWAIQIGAFKSRSLAENFRRSLEDSLGKRVEITVANEYYRVRILDLPSRKEVDENVIKLNKLGFKELWIIRLIAMQQERRLVTHADTMLTINEMPGIRNIARDTTGMIVQLGAFLNKSNALALLGKLSRPFGKNIMMTYENGYYKIRVRMSPLVRQTVLEEIEKLMPRPGELGLKEVWIMPIKTLPPETPVKKITENPPERLTIRLTKPLFETPASRYRQVTNADTLKGALPEPTVALQVGIFHREAEAIRAQRKIISKLNLPVEVIKQFEYYHVIVTGFFKKEETYKYYPELAGLGFPGITLIENYRSLK